QAEDGIRNWIQQQVESPFPQRRELRNGLHERRVGIDLELQRTLRLLLDIRGKAPAEPVPKIALGQRSSGKLVRNLEGMALGAADRRHSQRQRGQRGSRPQYDVTTRDGHVLLLMLRYLPRL